MFNLQKLRLPYREDAAFSILVFCIFLLPLAFSLFTYENFESVKFSLFLIMVGASAMVFFLKLPSQIQTTIKYNKYFYVLLGLFGAWAVLSAVLASDRVYAIFGFYYRYTSGLMFYATLLLCFFLLANLLDRGRLEFLLKVLIVDALAVAAVVYLQSFGWIFYAGLDIGGIFRGPSLLGNPNFSAMLLAVIFPLALYFFNLVPSRSAKIYYGISAFSIIVASLMLASRGAMLAIAVSVALGLASLGILKFQKKYFIGLLAITVAGLILGYFLLNISRPQAVAGIIQGIDTNTLTRFYAWRISLKGIALHPLFGVGPGNYALLFERIHSADMPGAIGVFDDAHNIFFHLAVTGGLPLAIIFLLGILAAGIVAFKKLKQEKSLLNLALLCSLAAWVVAACFTPVPLPMYAVLAVLITGMAMEHFISVPVNFSALKKWVLVCFSAAIISWGLVVLVSEHLLGLARNAYQSQNYSQSYRLAKVAFFINPTNGWNLIYKTASQIYLGENREVIVSGINKLKNLHPTQSESFAEASNLYAALFSQSQDKNDLVLAANNLEAAIKIDPLFAERYGRLALYYYQLGDLKKAQANIQQVLTLDRENFSAWILMAKLYQLQNNRDAVIMALTKALKINPNIEQLKYLLYLAKNLKDIKQVPIDINVRAPGI